MKKITLLILCLYSLVVQAQSINIPDANFKSALVGNLTINTNGDSVIQLSEAQAYSGVIDVQNSNISSLVGIEHFTNISELYCGMNYLTNLDVSLNVALTKLYCGANSLTNLDISNNTLLTEFGCYGNQLTTLNVDSNVALIKLASYGNKLSSLDVSNNTSLTTLYCHADSLSSLNVANGNNSNMAFDARNNIHLNCIEHDAGFNPVNAGWIKPAHTNWGSNCDQSIVGIIKTSQANALQNSKVYAIKYVAVSDSAFIIDSTTTNMSGYYSFSSVPQNIYIKAVPNVIIYPNEIPTYNLSASVFQNANIIDPLNVDSVSFSTIAGVSVGGNGLISGIVGNGTGKKSEIGSPIKDVSLVLINQNTGEVVKQTSTNANGFFSFNNLEEIIYSIWVDRVGVLNNLAPSISLVEKKNQNDLKFRLSKTQLELLGAVFVDDITNHYLIKIYPNPTTNVLNIETEDIVESIQLSNAIGKIIKIFSPHKRQLNLDDINKGVYFLELKSSQEIITTKIVVE